MTLLDVTAPQSAAETAMLRAALDAMGEGVAILDAQDRFVFWNRRYAEIHAESRHLERGLPFCRILELGLADGAYPEAVGREGEWLEARLARHRRSSSVEEQQLPDGRWVRIEERRTGDGGSISVAVDITSLKHRELELRSTKAFLNAVVESVPTMIIVRDVVEHRVVLLNRAGEDLLGMSRDDVLGKTLHDLFPTEEAERSIRRDREVIESGALGVFEEEPVTTRHQGVRYVQTKKLSMPQPDGSAQHILAVCEDITDRKAAAEALEQALHDAQAANRAKSEFLANMSHEVRTPLNGVLGLTQVLAGSGLSPSQLEVVEVIASSASILDRLLSNVLEVSAIETGRLELHPQLFDVGDLLDRLETGFGERARNKGLAFDVQVEPGTEMQLFADVERLEQILRNLLDNGLKFTERGSLRVRVGSRPEGCVFHVEDTGIGFDAPDGDAIFDHFRQMDGSATRRFGGSGLGLSISRQLAERMGGRLSAHSRPDEGSVFSLVMPLAARSLAAA